MATVHHLHRTVVAHEQWPDTIPTMPAGLDAQGRYPTRPFGASAYGDLHPIKPPPRVVPCSTVARWALWLRRLLG